MMTRERFAETNWKMSYEEYKKMLLSGMQKRKLYSQRCI